MEQISLKAEVRKTGGTGEARRVRRQGLIPAAIMKPGKESLPIAINAHEFELAVRGHRGGQLLVSLDIDGKPTAALMREMQRHVLTGKPEHLDFSEVSLTDKTRMTIQIRLTGEPEGVRVNGGVLEQMLRHVEVEGQIQDMIETFEVDVNDLKLNETVFVKDLQIGDKFHLITRADLAIATVAAHEDEAAAEGAEAEVEIITKGKKEEAKKGK